MLNIFDQEVASAATVALNFSYVSIEETQGKEIPAICILLQLFAVVFISYMTDPFCTTNQSLFVPVVLLSGLYALITVFCI